MNVHSNLKSLKQGTPPKVMNTDCHRAKFQKTGDSYILFQFYIIKFPHFISQTQCTLSKGHGYIFIILNCQEIILQMGNF